MSIARRILSAFITEVPPNWMTIMPAVSRKEALRLEDFGIQDGGARRAADRVVDEGDHAQVEDRAGADSSDGDRHAVLPLAIEARLRAPRLVDEMDRPFGGGGEAEPLR